jgi:hypothetical protein
VAALDNFHGIEKVHCNAAPLDEPYLVRVHQQGHHRFKANDYAFRAYLGDAILKREMGR